jgi:hypothetical protein
MCKKILAILLFVFWALPALADIGADTAWVRRYNGPGNDWDEGGFIAVDGSGNVYVTGTSWGIWTNSDYATIKYDSLGNQLWLQRYDGPQGGLEFPSGIAVDDSGNVYVTGESPYNISLNSDFVTIKYYPNGNTAWLRNYDGPVDEYDDPWDIVVDDSGNIYVTGCSGAAGGSYYDYTTIKYYSNGDTAWVRRYSGPADSTNWAFDMEVDGSGNVYVTGESYGGETSHDYATIKYYPNGDTAWLRRYNGPADSKDVACAIAVDDYGNVYVTGYSYGGSQTRNDYATIRYYPDGDIAWVKRYNKGTYSNDYARDIALDNSGNVYVTGTPATIKYDSDGNQVWIDSYYSGVDIAVDGSGNVYVTGGRPDYITIKYDTGGNQLWQQRYNGPEGASDVGRAIAVDGSGNVYVTGGSEGSGTDFDYATIKYVSASFLRGDANRDGAINVADIVYLINYLFRDGPVPPHWDSGDANCSKMIDIVDVICLINYLYRGGPPPGC